MRCYESHKLPGGRRDVFGKARVETKQLPESQPEDEIVQETRRGAPRSSAVMLSRPEIHLQKVPSPVDGRSFTATVDGMASFETDLLCRWSKFCFLQEVINETIFNICAVAGPSVQSVPCGSTGYIEGHGEKDFRAIRSQATGGAETGDRSSTTADTGIGPAGSEPRPTD